MAKDKQSKTKLGKPAEDAKPLRDGEVESIAEKFEAQRQALNVQAETENPELDTHDADAASVAAVKAAASDEGVASIEPMSEVAQPEPEPKPEVPTEIQDSPLGEHVVMHNGKPHMVLNVNGSNQLVDFDTASAQISKRVAADIELSNAQQLRQQLEQREQRIAAQEQAMQDKLNAKVNPEEFLGQAKDVVSTLFTGTEDEAAEQLASFLASNRPSVQVDPKQIATQAANIAAGMVTQKARKQDEVKAYKQFQQDYPEILADQFLYRTADGLTDDIVKEHPDWMPSQVLSEAGKRTREWIAQMKGVDSAEPNPLNSEAGNNPNKNRQQNKDGLVAIPQPATARHNIAPEPVKKETPRTILDDIRAARGQPVS